MSTRTPGLARRVAVIAAAAALSLIGVTTTAQAADAPGVGNISDQATTLTIHKHAGAEGDPGDGHPQELGADHEALAGVEFTVTPVTSRDGSAIDLTTAAGWQLIDGVEVGDVTAANGFAFGTPTTVTTAEDGSVTATLPKGLYLVTETGHGDQPIVSDSAPFLVTLPLPDARSAGAWIYDVHVYPKNQLGQAPTKEVAEPSAPVLGSQVTWTVKQTVPTLNQGDSFSSFVLQDTLDSRLGFVSATVDGLAADDYTVEHTGGTVTITLTGSGLTGLTAGDVLTARIVTTVDSLGDDGVIENTALTNVNGSDFTTNTPRTNWGALEILKHAAGDETKTLAGAVFGVYADAEATDRVGELTTGSDGRASISLWVGNDAVTSRQYWVKEEQAPAGYVLSDEVHAVQVTASGTTGVSLSIANTRTGAVELPLTGADGQLLLSVSGIALLLLAAGGALLVARRRRRS